MYDLSTPAGIADAEIAAMNAATWCPFWGWRSKMIGQVLCMGTN